MSFRKAEPSEQKTVVSDYKKYLKLFENNIYLSTSYIAISSTSVAYKDRYTTRIKINNFETKKENTLDECKTIIRGEKSIASLPNNQFAVAKGENIFIFCGETQQPLEAIQLSFEDEIESEEISTIDHDDLQVSLDGTIIAVRSVIRCSPDKNYYYNFIIDLDDYHVFRLRDSAQITLVNKNEWLAQHEIFHCVVQYQRGPSNRVKKTNISGFPKSTAKVYAWPQHPSVYIAAVLNDDELNDDDLFDLYIYQLEVSWWGLKAICGSKIGTIHSLHDSAVVHHHSLIFKDEAHEHLLTEFDLRTMTSKKIEIKNFDALFLKCKFPNGEIAVSGYSEEDDAEECMVVAELPSVRKDFEDLISEELETVFVDIRGINGIAKPLCNLMAQYAATPSAFFRPRSISAPTELGEEKDSKEVVSYCNPFSSLRKMLGL